MNQADALLAYQKYIRTNPADAEGARKSFFDTFGVDPNQPKSDFQRIAAQRKADLGVQQTAAQYQGDIGTAKAAAFGTIGKAAVLGGASLATGGLGVAPAMGLMGMAGLGAGALDETLKAHLGSEDIPKSAAGLAWRLGIEGTLSAAGEGGARAIGQSLKYLGKEALPSLAMRSAAKAEQGQQALVRVQQDSFNQIRDFVRSKGNPNVDLRPELNQFFTALGKRATGTSEVFDTAMKPVYQKLGQAGGGVLDKQPLDALMEIKSDLSYVAYKTKGMNTDELVALRNLTEQVDRKIANNLSSMGGSAANKIYTNYKAFTEQIRKDDAALSLAETGIKKLMGKAAGYVPGVDTAVDAGIRQKLAPWALEHLYSNERTAELVRKAVNLEAIGQRGAAQMAFDSAVNTSQLGTLAKDWTKQEAPNAAETR